MVRPFWFVSSELLADVLRAEIEAIAQLFSKYPDLRQLFDAAQTTIPQRTTCFELLAHREIVEIIDETLVGRYENPLTLNEEESNALDRSHNLVRSDAPAWVLEMNEVAEWLPDSINSVLPEPLRERGFYRDDPGREEAVRSAAKTLSTVKQIQSLTDGVIEQQLQRLKTRWAANSASLIGVQSQRLKKRKRSSKRDKQQADRDALIAEIADTTNTQAEFLQKMDERKVSPQLTWRPWLGWRLTYQKYPRFQKLIQQDKSRAIKRYHERRGR